MPRAVRTILGLLTVALTLTALGMWAYRAFGPKPVEPPHDVPFQTATAAGITFEVEYERNEGVKLIAAPEKDSIRFRRRDDVLEFDVGVLAINEIGMPEVKAGDVVRWNVSGPLLVNGQPVAPHPLQARPIDDEQHIDALWEALPSSYPRDTLSVAWAGTSRLLVAAHGDGAIRVWDVDQREIRKAMMTDAPRDARGRYDFRIAVSPDGKTVAAASIHDEIISLWDLATGNKTATFSEPKGKVNALGFASNDSLLEARGDKLYSRKLSNGGKQTTELGKVHDQFPPAFAISGTMFAWNDGAKVHLGSLRFTENGTASLPSTAGIDAMTSTGCLALTSDGGLLAVFDGDSRLAIHETKSGQVQRRLRWRGKLGSANSINALAFSPDGLTLAVGDNDSIRLYDVPSGRERGGMGSPWVRSLAYSADGRTLAAGLRYQPGLRLWETADLVAK